MSARRSRLVSGVLLAALPALVLGVAWQGSRGLWEPDEGRNTNVALGMLESHDWRVPRLNGDPYLDKPPLHYWSVASGIRFLGANEWGARVPNALLFAVTAVLIGALGCRMWDERTGRLSAWIYATTLAPFAAANVVNPDTCLATCVALFAYAYWRAEHGGDASSLRRCGWWLVAGVAVGLGVLAKGPAVLVFLPPFGLHLWIHRRQRTFALGPGPWLALAAAAVIALAWYLPITRSLPGAGAYLLDNQAIGRLVGAKWKRSPGWSGAFEVYVPTLVAGTLPWSGWWLANARRLARLRVQRLGTRGSLLCSWLLLPLIVFVFASSRLPLYVLPLFAPFALITGRALTVLWRERRDAAWRRQSVALLILWCLALLTLKLFAATYPTHRDARRQAAWIAAQGVDAGSELVVVDTALNGLRLYGYPELRWVRARDDAYPLFSPLPTLDGVALALAAVGRPAAFVVSSPAWGERVSADLARAGFDCEARTSDDRIALLLCAPVRAEATMAFGGGS